MTALVYLLVIALGAVAFVLAVLAVRRQPVIGFAAIGVIVTLLWEVPYPPALLSIFGLSVYPADLITVVLFSVGAIEVKQLRQNLQGWTVLWVFFGVLIALSMLRGIAAFGPATAVNEARALLYFFFAMTWIIAIRPDRLRLNTVSLVLGWSLVFVAVYHGVTYGIGGATSSVLVGDDVAHTGRLLVSGQAQVLLLCAGTLLLGPVGLREVRSRSTASSIIFLGVVVIAQHRSVWAAAALGMAAVLIWSKSRRARNQVFVLLLMGAWLVFFGWSSGTLQSFGSEFIESASDTATLDWRTSSWQSLISQAFDQGPTVVLGGEPFGTGFLRQLDTGRWTAVAAHNWFVTIFLRIGAIGLVTLAVLLVSALVRSRTLKPQWTFLLVATGVYGFFYTVDWYLAPWLGAAMSVSLGSLLQPAAGGPEQDLGSGVAADGGPPTDLGVKRST